MVLKLIFKFCILENKVNCKFRDLNVCLNFVYFSIFITNLLFFPFLSQSLISVSKFSVEMPYFWFLLVCCLDIDFCMTPAIFFVAWFKTSFIFWVIGCSAPRYLWADYAALAYEFKEAWYYFKNSCSTAILW